ncbi:hypothetical protein BC937DRAFT_94651 [Endogone sp. FLAS-F59071]|nr:hypothetical protein BC937DRAFT_94651 [Endogone sp. FLAS-F59071]|eukprot:RUS13872.1 hypothetical protein BC937DRAFT_94651 [Endogone sp. FLAS-F59071]
MTAPDLAYHDIASYFHLLSHLTYSLSESDVLDLVPPGVTYVHRSDRNPSATATRFVFRRTPTDVVDWDDFMEEVESYTPSDVPKYKRKDFEFKEDCRVSSESKLYSALDRNVYYMLGLLAGPNGHFNNHSAVAMEADPDRIFYVDPEQLRLAIEVKTVYRSL